MNSVQEETSKTKPRLPSGPLRKLLCRLGFHKWMNIYTVYFFDPNYKIPWNQYCVYCPAERENPICDR